MDDEPGIREGSPLALVVSDALGDTACEVVLAAAGQFSRGSFTLARLPHLGTAHQLELRLIREREVHRSVAVFHTIVNDVLRRNVADVLEAYRVPAVDLMGPTISALSVLTGQPSRGVAGSIHRTDAAYFRRIEALEYAVSHDDGRGSDDLGGADIVLIGVSRTSKTPLSMYLAQQGYRVANIPLAPGIEPPSTLQDVVPGRLFGLLSSVKALTEIRTARLGDSLARAVAASYADPLAIERELDASRRLMRRLGCIVLHTDGKAIEETALEIITHLERFSQLRR